MRWCEQCRGERVQAERAIWDRLERLEERQAEAWRAILFGVLPIAGALLMLALRR